MTALLPDRFADLEPFAAVWSLATEHERWDRRHASTLVELCAFYDACFPRVEEALEYCNQYPLDDLPVEAGNLLHLVYSLVMVAMAVEIFGQAKTIDAADAVLDRIREPAP
jgi:hypothetical protein